MAGLRTIRPPAFERLESKRDGIVAMRFFRAPFDDRTGTGGNHGDGHVPPVIGKDARHPDFTAQDVLHVLFLKECPRQRSQAYAFESLPAREAAGVNHNLGSVSGRSREVKVGAGPT